MHIEAIHEVGPCPLPCRKGCSHAKFAVRIRSKPKFGARCGQHLRESGPSSAGPTDALGGRDRGVGREGGEGVSIPSESRGPSENRRKRGKEGASQGGSEKKEKEIGGGRSA